MLQQQEGALRVEQGVPATVVMLVGTTGESSGAKPRAEAAHLANPGADTAAASTPHSCTWLCTSSQAYSIDGAGATTGGNAVGVTVAAGEGGEGLLAVVGAGVTAGVAAGGGGLLAVVGAEVTAGGAAGGGGGRLLAVLGVGVTAGIIVGEGGLGAGLVAAAVGDAVTIGVAGGVPAYGVVTGVVGEGVGMAVAGGLCSLGVGGRVKPGGPFSLTLAVGAGGGGDSGRGGGLAAVTGPVGDRVVGGGGEGGELAATVMPAVGEGVATGVVGAVGKGEAATTGAGGGEVATGVADAVGKGAAVTEGEKYWGGGGDNGTGGGEAKLGAGANAEASAELHCASVPGRVMTAVHTLIRLCVTSTNHTQEHTALRRHAKHSSVLCKTDACKTDVYTLCNSFQLHITANEMTRFARTCDLILTLRKECTVCRSSYWQIAGICTRVSVDKRSRCLHA